MQFQSTMWTMIGRAREGSRAALDNLLSRYRAPILDYLKLLGHAEEDAEDIVQEVFLQVAQERFLQSADREKGKFRTLLLRVTQHIRSSLLRKKYSLKRGGGKNELPLEEIVETAVAPDDEERFNTAWAKNLLRVGFEKLKRDSSRLRMAYHDALVMRFLQGKSYADIAKALKKKESDVVNYIHHGKRRLKEHLAELAQEYSSSQEEHAEELEILKKYAL